MAEETSVREVTAEDVAAHVAAHTLSGSIAALVGSGISARWDAVAVEIKPEQADAARANGLTVEKTKSGKLTAGLPYLRLDATTVEGALALNDGLMTDRVEGDVTKQRGMLYFHNYGWDLGIRSTVRNRILAKLEGPEAAVRRAAKGLIAAGIPEATAMEIAANALKAEGKLAADFTVGK